MAACSAFGCKNRPSKKVPGITFHRFPKNEELKTKWIKALRRKNWMPSACSILCSKHFTEEMIDRTFLCYVRLKENAIPTVFEMFPSTIKNEFCYEKQISINQQLTSLKDKISSSHLSHVETSELSDNLSDEASVKSSRKSLIHQKPVVLKDQIPFSHNSTVKVFNNSAIGNEESSRVPLVEQEHFVSKEQLSSGSTSVEILDNSTNLEESTRRLPVDRVQVILNQVSTKCNSQVGILSNSVSCKSCYRTLHKEQQAEKWRKKYQKEIKILQQRNRRYKKKIESLESILDGVKKKKIDYGSLLIITQS